MNAATSAKMKEILAYANKGHEIIPSFWQPIVGRSNTVSAAIRAAKKAGLLVQVGVDGIGRPKYAAPVKPLPVPTHAGPASIN